MSRGLLSKRLDQLERDGLVVRADGGYRPTLACEELRPLIFGLAEWGARWAFGEPRPDELDPDGADVVDPRGDRPGAAARRGRGRRAAGGRTVLHVRVPDARRSRFWFVVTPGDVSLCFTDPGFEVDVTVEPSLGVLYQVWLGTLRLPAAVRDGLVSSPAGASSCAGCPDALRLSPAAPYVRRGRAGAGAVTAAAV